MLTVFPAFPALTPTSYDGLFSFFFDTATPQTEIEIWDGDFDHGDFDGVTNQDTDDFNSAGIPSFDPPGSTAVPEGVAVGLGGSTGNPPDNTDPVGSIAFLREPSVVFDVVTPAFTMFSESDPSGNREWERFGISTGGPLTDGAAPDQVTGVLPAGAYEYRVRGLDLQNLNAIRLPFRLLCVDPLGDPCTPLRPFLVGDTVFTDINGDGVEDPGDPGIPGVVVNLVSVAGFVASATTALDGTYSFEVDPGDFTVEIDASSFDPGGALEGSTPTTPESISAMVINDNVLIYDFGYNAPANGSIGDYVWFDDNQNSLQDEPVAAGLAGVTVELLDNTLTVIATDITDADGAYLFEMLGPGDYTVRVDELTLPNPFGLFSTTVNNPLPVTLGVSEAFLDADFGYQEPPPQLGAIGDRVWDDTNGDGVQDPGEPGLDGVTVEILDVGGNVIGTQVTSGDGNYLFDQLPAGTYSVAVDPSTLPEDVAPTFDFDGVASANVASVTIGAGESKFDIDFGYTACGSCDGRVDVLTLQYNGSEAASVRVDQKIGFR